MAAAAVIAVPLLHGASGGAYADADRMVWITLFGLVAACCLPLTICLPRTIRGPAKPDAAQLGALLYLTGAMIAAVFTIVPSTALFGDLERRSGFLSDLALVLLFFAARPLGRRTAATRTVLVGLLCAGVVISAVAVFQALGWPPLADLPISRPGSLLGGPTYLGAYAALLLPIAIAASSGRLRGAICTLIVVTLVLTGARVCVLTAGLGAAIALAGAGGPSRRNVAILAGAALLLGALLWIPGIARHLPDGALPTRIDALFSGDDAHQRSLLYRDAIAAIPRPASALVTGHGPDSIGTLFAADLSEETALHFGGRVHIDRLHSSLLDVLFTRGGVALIGLLLMVGAAVHRGTRRASNDREAGPDDIEARRLRAGIVGAVVATFLDGALAVPGAASQLWLFVGCGILSASGTGAGEESRPDPRGGQGDDGSPAAWRHGLAAIGCVATIYALPLQVAWLALIWVALLPRRSGPGALRAGLAITGLYTVAAFFVRPAGAASMQGAEGHAERGQINLWITAAAIAAVLIVISRSSLHSGARPPIPRARRVGIGVLALLALFVGADLFFRLVSAVEARAATESQIAGAPPRAAEELLASAATRAPESTRYAALTLLAMADRAQAVRGDETILAAVVARTARPIESILHAGPVEARSLTLAARAVFRIAAVAPAFAVELRRVAATLAERAVATAPYSTPTLATAAQAALRDGDVESARRYIARGQALDGDDPTLGLLRARAEAYDHDLSAAAHHYGLCLPRLVTAATILETRLAIAIAAAARSSIDDAAALLVSAAELVPNAAPLDLQPLRPLLHFIDDARRDALFRAARRQQPDLARDINAIAAALIGSD